MKIDFSERLACRSIDTSRVRDGRTSSTSSSSPVLQSTQLQMTDNNASIEVGGGVIIPAGEAALQAEVAEATNTAFETADMTTVVAPSDEARQLLALEMNEVGPDGIPESPMMTYQKYLTMQVCLILLFIPLIVTTLFVISFVLLFTSSIVVLRAPYNSRFYFLHSNYFCQTLRKSESKSPYATPPTPASAPSISQSPTKSNPPIPMSSSKNEYCLPRDPMPEETMPSLR